MWLLDRLLAVPTLPTPPQSPPPALPDAPRRLALKRPLRAGRVGISSWQKVSARGRRDRH